MGVTQRLLKWEEALAPASCWREAGPDILVIPFLRPDFCAELVAAAETVGDFKPLPSDVENAAAPGQELRLNIIAPEIARQFDIHFQERIAPVLRTHWWPLNLGKTRMPFILRYSPDTQPVLDPHHDAAMVSMTILLNEGYEGGELTFPRQHWTSEGVGIGEVIVFPSRVTHVHWVMPVIAGTRFAMAAWIAVPGDEPDDAIAP